PFPIGLSRPAEVALGPGSRSHGWVPPREARRPPAEGRVVCSPGGAATQFAGSQPTSAANCARQNPSNGRSRHASPIARTDLWPIACGSTGGVAQSTAARTESLRLRSSALAHSVCLPSPHFSRGRLGSPAISPTNRRCTESGFACLIRLAL